MSDAIEERKDVLEELSERDDLRVSRYAKLLLDGE